MGKVKRGKKGHKPRPKPQHVPAPREEGGLSQADANAILRAVMVPKPIDPIEAAAVVTLIAARAVRPRSR